MAAFAVVACSDIRAVRDGCEVADPGDVVIELLDRRHNMDQRLTYLYISESDLPSHRPQNISSRMSLFQLELVNVDV